MFHYANLDAGQVKKPRILAKTFFVSSLVKSRVFQRVLCFLGLTLRVTLFAPEAVSQEPW